MAAAARTAVVSLGRAAAVSPAVRTKFGMVGSTRLISTSRYLAAASSFVEKLGEAAKVVTAISAEDAKKYIASEKPVIIDVRDGLDIADGIDGATHISLAELPFKADGSFSLPDDVKVGDKVLIPKGTCFVHPKLKDAKNAPILVSCGLGGQALLGAQILVDYGYTKVKAVDGGNIAWMNSGGKTCECMK